MELQKAHTEFVDFLKNEGKSSATVIAYQKDIEQLIDHLEKQGVVDVQAVEIDDLEDFMDKMTENGLTNKTISRKTNATRTFFKYLEDKSYIDTNVALQLKHPEVETQPPRILTKMEYRALRDTAKDDARTYAIIEVLLQTGLSISELSLIELEHLTIKNKDGVTEGTLYIPSRQSKDARSVPLNKAAVEAITRYMEEERPQIEGSKYLFITKSGNPLLVRNIRSTIDRYFKAAGIKGAKVNDLRHTFIAHHLSQGVSLQTVSKVVGHKRISTTEKYLEYIEVQPGSETMELVIL